VSDATGETLMAAGRAVSALYHHSHAIEHVYAMVRNRNQLAITLKGIEMEPGIVLYTLVDRELIKMLEEACTELGLPAVNLLNPVMKVFDSYLGQQSSGRVGAQHALDEDYFKRMEAVNFTMMHDDGQLPADIEQADVVLIGISRTSKTPTSIYLAQRGVKTVNIPLVPGVPLNPEVFAASHPLVIALIATPERIVQVRQNRVLALDNEFSDHSYTDRASIGEELSYARKLCIQNHWPMIDVSRRSVEETAAAILALLAKHRPVK
jgi:regulator of PEP synthase PpsR (kinase-PPPase family)